MRELLFILFVGLPFVCAGQYEIGHPVGDGFNVTDSVAGSQLPAGSVTECDIDAPKPAVDYIPVVGPVFGTPILSLVYAGIVTDFAGMQQQVGFPLWHNGGVVVDGESMTMPGLMRIDTGSIGIYQRFGNFSVYGGGGANKYGYFQGVHTQYGINGSVTYRFSPGIHFTAFGSCYFGTPPVLGGGLPMPPSMMGYYAVSRFGGSLHYQFNENFGLDVGGQMVQKVGTSNYRFEPIVTPYVKVGKIGIGLPVGQIVNGLLR